ncbi:hypothetical protein [Natronococcus sp. A-GB1]|uniref:hypothetical protein n=1 Tax=Natronococcus sp. A-GB1 TaxID=3037648 RepID=UPI0031F31C32
MYTVLVPVDGDDDRIDAQLEAVRELAAGTNRSPSTYSTRGKNSTSRPRTSTMSPSVRSRRS